MRHLLLIRAVCSPLKSSAYRRCITTCIAIRAHREYRRALLQSHSFSSASSVMSHQVKQASGASFDQDESSKGSARATHHKGLPKRRNTHFLCFPLVTETSIPQLDKSLRYFREITTKPSADNTAGRRRGKDSDTPDRQIQNATRNAQSEHVSGNADETGSDTFQATALPFSNPDLQILPIVAHRPPGTFHLTLGVMDLSAQEEMDRALKLLQEIDYAEVLNTVSAVHDPTRYHPGTTRQQTKETSQESKDQSEVGSKLESLKRPISPPRIYFSDNEHLPNFDSTKPPRISLTGLSTFPSTKSSRVFYAKPSPSPGTPFPLLALGKAIQGKFREAGFITETRSLVLHATVANMRYATQARGGRTSKGRSSRFGKARWQDGQVDATELIKCFDYHKGDVDAYINGNTSPLEGGNEFIWSEGVVVNRVAICKMGAEKTDDETLGMVYPPVGEKQIFL